MCYGRLSICLVLGFPKSLGRCGTWFLRNNARSSLLLVTDTSFGPDIYLLVPMPVHAASRHPNNALPSTCSVISDGAPCWTYDSPICNINCDNLRCRRGQLLVPLKPTRFSVSPGLGDGRYYIQAGTTGIVPAFQYHWSLPRPRKLLQFAEQKNPD